MAMLTLVQTAARQAGEKGRGHRHGRGRGEACTVEEEVEVEILGRMTIVTTAVN